ncbi:MAG: arsenite methyltransferase [Candidatus Bathyarchaeia archaeon]
MRDEEIKAKVRERYATAAREGRHIIVGGNCCQHFQDPVGRSAGYTREDFDWLPPTVTEVSLGCGNPTALAGLRDGEIVLDLGSGGGIDAFLAAKKVGPKGKVIGIDMTPAMVERARTNAERLGISNVEFKLGEMEKIPLENGTIDVVISNCVINLSPNKPQVFREIYRVLKPRGRIAISDMATNGPIPEVVQHLIGLWVGCIAGALNVREYEEMLRDAGFRDIKVTVNHTYTQSEIEQIAACCYNSKDTLTSTLISQLAGKISSVNVEAVK